MGTLKIDAGQVRSALADYKNDILDGNGHRVVRELEQARRQVWDRMSELNDGARDAGRDLLASEARTYDDLEKILTEATELLDQAKGQQRSLQRIAKRDGTDAVFTAGWQRGDGEYDNPELRRAWDGFLRTGNAAELRAQGVATGAAGGFTVPEGFRKRLTETLKAHGGVRSVAEVITTQEGNDLPWPTVDDTAQEGEALAENTAATEQDVTLGQKKLGAFMYGSQIVKISIQLAQDNGIDFEGKLARLLAERIHRNTSGLYVTGAGTTEPQGLVTGGTVGVTGATGQTTSVIYDDLVDLVHSVDPAYRENADENVFIMNDSTFKTVRKIKDSDGRPLVEPDVKRGAPNTILGHRVVIDQGVPSMAASAKSIAFGNIRAGYVIRDVRGIDVVRFGERYMDALQLGFLAYMRTDGLVQDASAFRLYQNAAS